MKDKLFISVSKMETEIVQELNDIFENAIKSKVADIHFQKNDSVSRVRFRMPGGSLHDHKEYSIEQMRVFDEKIRAVARLSVVDRQDTQDGRISLRIHGANIDVRVAISPGVNGSQLIVCRLLDQSNSNRRLSDIKMTPSVNEAFGKILSEPNGLLLVTGPTGSGKTTTLYALLNELNSETRNIITIENPVEYRIAQFHQINVDGQSITFATALRSVLRQDPDVILIGEIRDKETAMIAVQAAITGHLVLSTLHANNAAMAITRMVEFGIDPHTLSASLRGVTAQRLIRTLANPHNLTKHEPNAMEKVWLRAQNIHRPSAEYFKTSNPKDFKGFVPVMEVILADSRVKKSFLLGNEAIYAAASRQPQFETLAQAAERVAYGGMTTLEEASHVSSAQEAPIINNRRVGQILIKNGLVKSETIDEMLDLQCEMRKNGHQQAIGGMLIEGGFCSHQELIDAIGFTAEAQDILSRICISDEKRQMLSSLVKKWTSGIDSLFELAISAKLTTSEELIDEINR
jgi:general secretion pathway protein E